MVSLFGFASCCALFLKHYGPARDMGVFQVVAVRAKLLIQEGAGVSMCGPGMGMGVGEWLILSLWRGF